MRRLRSMIRGEEGFTIVEMLAAAVVLAVGVGAMLTVFSASGRLTQAAERQTAMAHRASLELERIKSLPWGQVALTGTSSQWSTNPGDYTYVSGVSGACPGAPAGAAPQYQPDHSGNSSATEPLVINGCNYTLAGTSTTMAGGVLAPATPWTDGNYSGNVYDFITWVNDPTCSQTTPSGSDCPTSNDYKRVTIVVTFTPPAGTPQSQVQPSHPVIVSAFLPNPNQNSAKNPVATSNCTNTAGLTGPCSTTSGTPAPFFPCDSSYQNSSCGSGPPCTGNPLDQTLVKVGILAPNPDLLGTTSPTGDCQSGGTPTPPCYGLGMLSSNCQGLPIVPTPPCTGNSCSSGSGGCTAGGNNATCTSNAACGTAPPSDNSKAHSWVTSAYPFGSSVNLTGAGSMTAYLSSGSGAAVNATVCLGVYLVPGGVLSVTSNLLASRVGVIAAANVAAQAGFPTPVSFSFDLGAGAGLGANVLGTRVEVVLWVASSASTDVQIDYDQVEAASEITLVEN